ncbi:hypothetical protein A2954_01755 [Candidatus Roizmanbacteria bacterium RIFCSPLOWO2_01_FULL_37_12]|uniref:Uncharacterized protein n=1 Tax=Candidatus Roizmanbacteria bacterium RIFCSPLOWO2_01_FULL_37_12 TaxID=1802056 RepID=A0A1F7I9D6_9BACT|nr:MAG: hypothetical protein A3D76_05900 [Candidatus Roizmanbacteria bacterium RIFCSPHIGHO2_02_FULL_37_9b]OGK39973.1 MAG: hypothetical protein A2954_01755 [Candidatus Roizmanbacteria bacterium RIFCSPLOWO2_01_FULL_37_12]
MKNKMLIALTFLGIVLFAGVKVNAQNENFHSNLIKKIAEKFNLKESDVSSVFTDFRNERQAERQKEIEERLTQAVKDEKITEAQRQAILKHHEELKNNQPDPEEFKNLTMEQRRQKMQEKKQEMESWALENGLDLDTIHGLMGFSQGFGKRRFWSK